MPDTFPLISIIIPYYNHDRFVKRTLDSILEDTYPNKEIIIIDDGSPEIRANNLEEWVFSHQNEIPIVHFKRENKGITKTLNELIGLSRGKYIALIASDDYFINNTFARRVDFLQNHPEKLMLVSDAIVVDDDDTLLFSSAMFEQRKSQKKRYLTDYKLKKEIITRWAIVGPTGFIDRKLFDIVGMYDENLMIEDWDFYLRVVSKNLLIFFDEKVAAYRWHAFNISKDKKTEEKRDRCLCETIKKNMNLFRFPHRYFAWKKVRKCMKRYESN